MLCMNNYPRKYIDDCREKVNVQLSAFADKNTGIHFSSRVAPVNHQFRGRHVSALA
jgi:hypothetical protein